MTLDELAASARTLSRSAASFIGTARTLPATLGVAAALAALLPALPTSAQKPAAAPEPTLQIGGAVGKPAKWTAAQMAAQFAGDIKPLAYTLKGVKHTAQKAIPLLALLRAAAPKVNAHVKHGELQFVIAASGQDGYTVDFGYADLLPEIGNKAVWVALDEDGKPLTGESGPAELIVPDDGKPARWVHSLVRIVVVDGSQTPDAEAK